MFQDIVVWTMVLGAAVYLGYILFPKKNSGGDCSTGCGNCSQFDNAGE